MIAKNRTSERGNAMIEFALSISLLGVLFTGVYQYGYTMHVYNSLATAVSNASRAAMRTTLRADNRIAFTTAVQNLVVYGNTAGTGSAILPGLTRSHVNVTLVPDSPTAAPQVVTVAIDGYTVDGMFGRYTLNGRPQLSMRYAGNFMVPESGSGGGGGGGK